MTTLMDGLTIPEGWTSEPLWGRPNYVTLTSPGEGTKRGYVTLDFKARGFRSGCTCTGPLVSTKKYAGRGWKQKLVNEAVEWLTGVLGSGVRRPLPV